MLLFVCLSVFLHGRVHGLRSASLVSHSFWAHVSVSCLLPDWLGGWLVGCLPACVRPSPAGLCARAAQSFRWSGRPNKRLAQRRSLPAKERIRRRTWNPDRDLRQRIGRSIDWKEGRKEGGRKEGRKGRRKGGTSYRVPRSSELIRRSRIKWCGALRPSAPDQ